MTTITSQQDNQISTFWLWGLRAVWVITFALLLLFFIGGIPYQFQELTIPCDGGDCTVLKVTTEEIALLEEMGLSIRAFAGFHIFIELLIASTAGALGVFIFAFRFKDKVGVTLAFMLILIGLNFLLETDAAFIAYNPQYAPTFSFLSGMTVIPLILLLYTFPNGRFTPGWTAYFIIPFMIFMTVASFFYDFLAASIATTVDVILTGIFVMMIVLGFVSQIYRYRRISTPSQQQQTKWVILGFSALIFVIVNYYLWYALFLPGPGLSRLFLYTFGYAFFALFLVFFPMTFVIAIVRHRLWDIDIIIRRTVQYAAVSAILVGIYYGSVVILQSFFAAVLGTQSPVTIVISTLIIAALFNPLRQRIQMIVDRRFYRQKYDAEQILAQFAQTARDEVELDQLKAGLVYTVQQTVQPDQISIWLKPTKTQR